MSDLSFEILQAIHQNDPKTLSLVLESETQWGRTIDVVTKAWLDCLCKQQWEVCDVLFEHRWSEFLSIPLCTQMLASPPERMRQWVKIMNQGGWCQEQEEAHHLFFLGINEHTHPQSLLELLQSKAPRRRKNAPRSIHLSLVIHLARSRHPKAKWSWSEAEEERVRRWVWQDMQVSDVLKVTQAILQNEMAHKITRIRKQTLSEDPSVSCADMWTLWLPEIRSMSDQQIDQLLTEEPKWRQSFYASHPTYRRFKLEDVFPQWEEMLVAIQKEDLLRKIQPATRVSSSLKKL